MKVHTEKIWNSYTIPEPASGETISEVDAIVPDVGPGMRGDVVVVAGVCKRIDEDENAVCRNNN